MSSLNKVLLIGRLGRDPELRYTQTNRAVANFSLATDEGYTDRNSGERVERTEWHRIVVWGRQAENCDKYLSKGRLVFIEGRLQTREYEDRDNNKRRTTEIIAHQVTFLGGKGESRSSGGGEIPPPKDDDMPFDSGFSDDEIPF